MKKKPSRSAKLLTPMRLRAYDIVTRAVEEGVELGMSRVYKYSEAPTRESLVESIEREVKSNLCDVINFNDSQD